MVCVQFSVSLLSFLNPILITTFLCQYDELPLIGYFALLLCSFIPPFIQFGVRYSDIMYRAYFIGCVFSAGQILVMFSPEHVALGVFLMGLAGFHYSEYALTSIFKEDKLSNDSFLLNHSTAYHLSMLAAMTEYTAEYLNMDQKVYMPIAMFGGCVMVCGDAVRKISMITAAESFDHIVQTDKAEQHKLVTHGVYSLSRHPSYAGWFYWSIGSQILLCNPLCTVAFAVVSWRFFNERIEEEECFLLRFFGQRYKEYKDTVGVGIPGITGYAITPKHAAYLLHCKDDHDKAEQEEREEQEDQEEYVEKNKDL